MSDFYWSMDENGNPYLSHHGIKGQQWGNRRFQNEDGSLTEAGKHRYGVGEHKDWKRLKKDAANDAKEYARAKAYYGEGAGTRRKKIKNLISERMKDPDYKAEFERQLAGQDMEKAQKTANRERKVQDTKNTVGKTARGVKNFLLGNAVPMTTTAMAIGAALKYTGAGQRLARFGKYRLSVVMNKVQSSGALDWLKRKIGR